MLHVQRYETQLEFENLRHLKITFKECFNDILPKKLLYINVSSHAQCNVWIASPVLGFSGARNSQQPPVLRMPRC